MFLDYPNKLDAEKVIPSVNPASFSRPKIFCDNELTPQNFLYQGENIEVLRALVDDESVRGNVRLIYIDPPYASKQSFKHRKNLNEHAYSDELHGAEYIEFLRRRLILLRELLADDGSIYLHLDDKIAFHMKVVMDEVFGAKNFRNWIIRKKCHSKNYTKRQFGNTADYILFYSKTPKYVWTRSYESANIYSFEQRFPRIEKETNRRFALVPIYAPGVRNGKTGEPWRGKLPPHGKHWQVVPEELEKLAQAGEIYWSSTGNPRRKIYADRDKGVPVQDIWIKFMDFRNQNMSETGYPTEKNASLLKRIVEASSNPGDLVLDCFCGSGTTLEVSRDLGRRWIGVDSSKLAIKTTIGRLTCEPEVEPVEDRQLELLARKSANDSAETRYQSFLFMKTRKQPAIPS